MFTSFNFPSFFPPLLVSSLLFSFARLTSPLLSIPLPILHRPTLLMPLPLTLVHCQSNKWKLLLLKRLSVLPSRSLQSLTKRSRWTMVTTVSVQFLEPHFPERMEERVHRNSTFSSPSLVLPNPPFFLPPSPTVPQVALGVYKVSFRDSICQHLFLRKISQLFSYSINWLILHLLLTSSSSYSTRLQTMVPLRTPSESLSKLVTVTSTLVSNSEELVRN